MASKKRGPKPDPHRAEVKELQRKLARAEKRDVRKSIFEDPNGMVLEIKAPASPAVGAESPGVQAVIDAWSAR